MPAESKRSGRQGPVTLAILVPCYNEEAALPDTGKILSRFCAQMQQADVISPASKIILIDDGSSDNTWGEIEALAAGSDRFAAIRLSRNFGHQNALCCGLNEIDADAIITIDADLQDDVDAMREMITAYQAGADIVYGVRAHRDTDSWFKRVSALSYYHFLRALGADIVVNHADYRLMSRRAASALRRYSETNLFLRGIVPQLGFATRTVSYDRHPRSKGTTKYPLGKMMALALEGVTSFSVRPLRWITMTGIVLSCVSFVAGLWAIIVRMAGGSVVTGWASTVIPLYFLGGLQILSLGIVGEYLGKVYLETKHRPRFIVAERVGSPPGNWRTPD